MLGLYMTKEMNKYDNNVSDVDYLNDKTYQPKTAIQRKIRLTGFLILYTFITIFTLTIVFLVPGLLL